MAGNSLATLLQQARFFRSKELSFTDADIQVLQSQPLRTATGEPAGAWQLVQVRDLAPYQLFLNKDPDAAKAPKAAANTAMDAAPLADVTETVLMDNLDVLGKLESYCDPVLPAGAGARPMGVEQSNTSLIVGDTVALKVFRQLEPGINRDVETLQGLQSVGSTVIPKLRGVWTKDGCVTAYAQDLVPDATDAWEIAAEINQQALGELTRTMHEDLAAAFPTASLSGAELAASLRQRYADVCQIAPLLRDYADNVERMFANVEKVGDVNTQRIHGDYHLGQVLSSHGKLYVIDFEGEPARPLSQRNMPDSPLRDVAGMVRSLGYAKLDADDYIAACGVQRDLLLNAYILDKALYEVAYEVANRPDWVDIPLSAVKEIVG